MKAWAHSTIDRCFLMSEVDPDDVLFRRNYLMLQYVDTKVWRDLLFAGMRYRLWEAQRHSRAGSTSSSLSLPRPHPCPPHTTTPFCDPIPAFARSRKKLWQDTV